MFFKVKVVPVVFGKITCIFKSNLGRCSISKSKAVPPLQLYSCSVLPDTNTLSCGGSILKLAEESLIFISFSAGKPLSSLIFADTVLNFIFLTQSFISCGTSCSLSTVRPEGCCSVISLNFLISSAKVTGRLFCFVYVALFSFTLNAGV